MLCRLLIPFYPVSHYLGYNAMDDFFPSMALKPNPQCDDNHCVKRQAEWQEKERLRPKEEVVEVVEEVTHEDNEWHIELVEEDAPAPVGEPEIRTETSPVPFLMMPEAPTVELEEGLEFAYDAPDVVEGDAEAVETVESSGVEGQSLEELMAQMKGI